MGMGMRKFMQTFVLAQQVRQYLTLTHVSISLSPSMRGMGNVEEYLLLKTGKNFLSKTTEEVVFWAAEW